MQENIMEKRRFPRLDYRIPMRYKKIESDAQIFMGSLMQNISEGGACLTTYEFLPINIRLGLEIPLASDTRPLASTCRVAWVKKAAFSEQYSVGIEFVHIAQEDTLHIGQFIFNKSVEKVI